MCEYAMHIHVIAPNVETRFTNHVKTTRNIRRQVEKREKGDHGPFALEELTLRNTRPQNAVQNIKAGQGTPM